MKITKKGDEQKEKVNCKSLKVWRPFFLAIDFYIMNL